MFLLLLILLADYRYLCTIITMQRYTSIGTALSASIFSPLLLCSSGVFPLNRSKNRTCITRAAKRISASIAVRNTTVPIFVCFPHTAVTRSVRKVDKLLLFIPPNVNFIFHKIPLSQRNFFASLQ